MNQSVDRLRRTIEIAEDHAEEAMNTLVKLLRCGDPAIMRQAAMGILAYSHGRPEKIIRIEHGERTVKPIELVLSPVSQGPKTTEQPSETIPDTELQ